MAVDAARRQARCRVVALERRDASAPAARCRLPSATPGPRREQRERVVAGGLIEDRVVVGRLAQRLGIDRQVEGVLARTQADRQRAPWPESSDQAAHRSRVRPGRPPSTAYCSAKYEPARPERAAGEDLDFVQHRLRQAARALAAVRQLDLDRDRKGRLRRHAGQPEPTAAKRLAKGGQVRHRCVARLAREPIAVSENRQRARGRGACKNDKDETRPEARAKQYERSS